MVLREGSTQQARGCLVVIGLQRTSYERAMVQPRIEEAAKPFPTTGDWGSARVDRQIISDARRGAAGEPPDFLQAWGSSWGDR